MWRLLLLSICSVVCFEQYNDDLGFYELEKDEWMYEFGSKGVGQEIYGIEKEIGSTEEASQTIIPIEVEADHCTSLTYVRVVVKGSEPSRVYFDHVKKEILIQFTHGHHGYRVGVYSYGYTDDNCLEEFYTSYVNKMIGELEVDHTS